MRVLGLDFETTGFNYQENDRITEIGAVLWETDNQQPLLTFSEYLYEESYPPQSDEIVRITGITNEMLKEFGVSPALGFARLANLVEKYKVKYIVAHNGENFDRPFLGAELNRHLPYIHALAPDAGGGRDAVSDCVRLGGVPWIDTRSDIPYEVEPDSRKLKHLALDLGFINPFPHRALFDVLTMLKVLSASDIEKVVEYQKIPWAVMRAVVDYKDKDQAKALRYSWEKIGEKQYPKFWVKKVKENQIEKEIEDGKKAGFQSVRIE